MSSSDEGNSIDAVISGKDTSPINPLIQPLPWQFELHKRVKLLPWWLLYNIGVVEEAILKNKIIKQATDIGLQDRWTSKLSEACSI